MPKKTSAIKNKLYPMVVDRMSITTNKKAYMDAISSHFADKANDLYSEVPATRITFSEAAVNKYFKALNIEPKEVEKIVGETYYGPVTSFNPRAAKDPFTVTQLSVVRYYFEKKLKKDTELAMVYLAFSGKFYPSLHFRSFRFEPDEQVLNFVINSNLSAKFDIFSAGSVIGAVTSICNTWLDSYSDKMHRFEDEDVVYLIQQLHSRIGSFMKNIASEYYKEHKKSNKGKITYDSDNRDEDNYRVADSDVLRMQRVVENTTTRLTSKAIDYRICKACSDDNIRPNEIKSIIESILNDTENLPAVRELLNLIVANYWNNSKEKIKEVSDLNFVSYSITPKPNAKQKEILRQKEIIEELLMNNSTAYARRRSRAATKNSYERAILLYFVLSIHNANR